MFAKAMLQARTLQQKSTPVRSWYAMTNLSARNFASKSASRSPSTILNVSNCFRGDCGCKKRGCQTIGDLHEGSPS